MTKGSLFKTLAMGLLVSSLGGCFWQTAPAPVETSPPPSPVVSFMIDATPGTSAVLDDPVFGPDVRVTLEVSFLSASGETCRRATVLSAQQDAEIAVICRNPKGQWVLAPRIWGGGITQ